MDNSGAVPRLFDIREVMMDSVPVSVKPDFSVRNPRTISDSHILNLVRIKTQVKLCTCYSVDIYSCSVAL